MHSVWDVECCEGLWGGSRCSLQALCLLRSGVGDHIPKWRSCLQGLLKSEWHQNWPSKRVTLILKLGKKENFWRMIMLHFSATTTLHSYSSFYGLFSSLKGKYEMLFYRKKKQQMSLEWQLSPTISHRKKSYIFVWFGILICSEICITEVKSMEFFLF